MPTVPTNVTRIVAFTEFRWMLANGHICFSRRLRQKTKQRVTKGAGGGGGSTAICKDGALFCFCTVQIMGIEGNLEINSSFLG